MREHEGAKRWRISSLPKVLSPLSLLKNTYYLNASRIGKVRLPFFSFGLFTPGHTRRNSWGGTDILLRMHTSPHLRWQATSTKFPSVNDCGSAWIRSLAEPPSIPQSLHTAQVPFRAAWDKWGCLSATRLDLACLSSGSVAAEASPPPPRCAGVPGHAYPSQQIPVLFVSPSLPGIDPCSKELKK